MLFVAISNQVSLKLKPAPYLCNAPLVNLALLKQHQTHFPILIATAGGDGAFIAGTRNRELRLEAERKVTRCV